MRGRQNGDIRIAGGVLPTLLLYAARDKFATYHHFEKSEFFQGVPLVQPGGPPDSRQWSQAASGAREKKGRGKVICKEGGERSDEKKTPTCENAGPAFG